MLIGLGGFCRPFGCFTAKKVPSRGYKGMVELKRSFFGCCRGFYVDCRSLEHSAHDFLTLGSEWKISGVSLS